MIKKEIFKCRKCHYFPLKIELQTIFTNQEAFKCPVCSQQKAYDSNKIFLDNQSYVYEVNGKQSQSSVLSSQVIKTQGNGQNKKHCLIFFEMSSQFHESFYLNPINPQLMNSFNVNKQSALSNKSHIFFLLNYQVKKELANLSVQQGKNYLRQKKTTRKMSKFEHMLYCLDVYLMKLHELSQEKIIIILKTFVKNLARSQDSHQERISTTNQSNLKILKEFVFKLQTYGKSSQTKQAKEIKEALYNANPTYDVLEDEKQIQNFANQAKDFIKEFYKIQITETNSSNYFDSNVKLTTCSIFSQNYDEQQVKKVLNLVNTHDKNLNKVQNCKVHYFYLQNSSSKSVRQQSVPIEQPKILKISQHQIYHSFIFIPYYKGKQNIEKTIQNMIHKSAQKQKSFHFQQKNLKCLSFPTIPNDQTLREINLNQNDKQSSCLYIFWKPEVHNKNIKANKIKSKQILQRFEKQLPSSTTSYQINQFINKSKGQIVEMILKHSSVKNKFRQNIILDRLYCMVKKCQIYFVFDYENIIKEHFQQLDFIQEHSLPDVLKKYSRTYESQQTKTIDNPFKKGNNRVYLTKYHISQPQQNYEVTSSEQDNDRQSL